MDLFEDSTHSFVVKISIEETPAKDGKQSWQGEITHVSTGTHYLFTQWEKMEGFLKSHLKEVKLPSKPRPDWRSWWFRSRSPKDD
ncbi:MAG: hypothetical protein H6658_03235 [Ardenticatenaceae bacterium]|nr:hypothetical protein [Ardenticatenaceae bacterium]